MPLHFPTDTFFESSGKIANEFGENLRDGVVSLGCNLWSSFPKWLTSSKLPQNSWARGYMNQMCSPIQPPVPYPDTPFIGGQCLVEYEVLQEAETFFNGQPRANQNSRHLVYGPIGDAGVARPIPANDPRIVGFYVDGFDNLGNPRTFVTPIGGVGWTANQIDVVIIRRDGQPDNCGDPSGSYPDRVPTRSDRERVININNPDNVDIDIQICNYDFSEYNFPMYFTVNGSVAVLDLGGLTFYPPNGATDLNGGNILGIPESKCESPTSYPDSEYPVAPELDNQKTEEQEVEIKRCVDGMIQTETITVPVPVASNNGFRTVVGQNNQIAEDTCGDSNDCSLGFPEYYGIQPGANRPAIVYLWKIYEDDVWGQSTYSSTVVYPTQAAIDNIPNLLNIEKKVGGWKTYLRLIDGSQIQATGETEALSITNFNFLKDQVDPQNFPANTDDATITYLDPRLENRILTLRQIEYYPKGRNANINPTIKRIIEPPMP